MAYQNEKQTKTPGQDEKQRPEKQHVQEQPLFGLPNSFMTTMPVPPPPGTPNSVMRELLEPQIPDAEAEADRLSAGIRSGTPNSVRREMGSRLGSDFSSVRFHTGPESIRRNDFMGSLAYTRGSDVFFGSGGFSPSVAAHELVHTVQQGAVPGRVTQSVPFATVQRAPGENGNDDDDHDDDDVLSLEDDPDFKASQTPSASLPGQPLTFDYNNMQPGQLAGDPNVEKKIQKGVSPASQVPPTGEKPPNGGVTAVTEIPAAYDHDALMKRSAAFLAESRNAIAEVEKLERLGKSDESESHQPPSSVKPEGGAAATAAADPLKVEKGTAPKNVPPVSQIPADGKNPPEVAAAAAAAPPEAAEGAAPAHEIHAPEANPLEGWDEGEEVNPIFNNRKNISRMEKMQLIRENLQPLQLQMAANQQLYNALVRIVNYLTGLNDQALDEEKQLSSDMAGTLIHISGSMRFSEVQMTEILALEQNPERLDDGNTEDLQRDLDQMNRNLQDSGRVMQGLMEDWDQLVPLRKQQVLKEVDELNQQLQRLRAPEMDDRILRMKQQLMIQKDSISRKIARANGPNHNRPQLEQQRDHVAKQIKRLNQLPNDLIMLSSRLQGFQTQLNYDGTTYLDVIDVKADINEWKRDFEKHRIAQLFAELVDPNQVFDKQERRWRASKEPVRIDDMVKYYKAYRSLRGDDLGEIQRPVIDGLVAVDAAVPELGGGPAAADHGAPDEGANPPAPAAAGHDAPDEGANPPAPAAADHDDHDEEANPAAPVINPANPGAPGAGPNPAIPAGAPPSGQYQKADDFVSKANKVIPVADAPRNTLVGLNDIFKLIVMGDFHDNGKLADDVKDPKWYDHWNPAKAKEGYGWYTDKAVPATNVILGAYGALTSAFNAYAMWEETQRKYHNQDIGGRRRDTAVSALDTISSFGKTASSVVGMFPGGNASALAAFLNMFTGAIDTGVGAGQFVQGAVDWSKVNEGMDELGPMDHKPEDEVLKRSWDSLTDQEKLYYSFKHGRSTQKINTWAGLMKGLSGLMSFGSGLSTVIGAAPVAAGLQLGAAAMNLARTAFLRGMNARLRKRVVAEHYGIDWDKEMKRVREMIWNYNPNFNMPDQFVREVILKAHGSTEATRTAAYKKIRSDRAEFLMSIARDPGRQYHHAAVTVVKAMGVNPVGTDTQGHEIFAPGAEKILEEKLGG